MAGVMKTFVWMPVACLAGLIVGAWGPREELRASLDGMRRKAEQEAKWGTSRAVSANGFQTFARLANIHPAAVRPHRKQAAAKPLFAGATNRPPSKIAAAVTNRPSAVSAAATGQPPEKQERLAPKDLRARIEEAQSVWSTRVELARAKWHEKLGLDADAADKFDSVLDNMNEQLYDTMLAMSALLAQQDKMTPELGMKMMGDATSIMAETYDKLGACVPADRRADISDMQVFEFIDPGVAEPLIDVQDKLENFHMQQGGNTK